MAAATPSGARGLSIPALVAIGFFWVAGGIYGNEELVAAGPPLYVIIWVVVTGCLFALPTALITAEMATAFPDDGGQVAWVHKACGRRIAGHNAFWVWFLTCMDAAVYPQMAAQYVDKAVHLSDFGRRLVPVAIILGVTMMNLAGLVCVVSSQLFLFVVSLTPSLVYIFAGLPLLFQPSFALSREGAVDWGLLLSWSLWLYSGFPTLGTMAGEVERPQVTYPAVIGVLLPAVLALNTLPQIISLQIDPVTDNYEAGHYGPLAGQLVGGWLQVAFVAGALFSLLGMYHSQILCAERSVGAFLEMQFQPWASPQGPHDAAVLPDGRSDPGTGGDDSAAEGTNVSTASDNDRLSLEVTDDCDGAGVRDFAASAPPPAWSRRLGSWLCSPPAAGGASRGIILFSAAVEMALSWMHYESIVIVEMMLFSLSNMLFLYSFLVLCRWKPLGPRPAFRIPGGLCAGVVVLVPSLIIGCGTLAVNLATPVQAIAFSSVLLAGLAAHACSALHSAICKPSGFGKAVPPGSAEERKSGP